MHPGLWGVGLGRAGVPIFYHHTLEIARESHG